MGGLRFACRPGCTNCCRVPGFVYHRLRLRKPRRSQCYFLAADGCRIHPVKPTQCRLFPFWPELVEDRDVWRETAALCPGIGTGPVFQIGTALEIAAEMKRAYPALY